MAISTQDASAVLTNALMVRYTERIRPTAFLQSFFTSAFKPTKNVRISVRRGTKKIAVDVQRYSDGQLNIMSFDDEKLFEPPHYHEYIILNNHALYDAMLGLISATNSGVVPGDEAAFRANINAILSDWSDQLDLIIDKIYRAVEKMCADIMDTGKILLTNHDSIDFKRKAGSLVAYAAGNDWSVNTVDPYETMKTACQWIRKNGNSGATTFDMIVGDEALSALLSNDLFVEKMDTRRMDLGMIGMAQQGAEGSTYHGQVSAGSYLVRIWGYDQYYNDGSSDVPYVNPKKAIFIPADKQFDLAWALVPNLIKSAPQTGEFLIKEYMNEEKAMHRMDVKAAPLPVPTSIDRLYTIQVLN